MAVRKKRPATKPRASTKTKPKARMSAKAKPATKTGTSGRVARVEAAAASALAPNWRKAAATPQTAAQKKRAASLTNVAKASSRKSAAAGRLAQGKRGSASDWYTSMQTEVAEKGKFKSQHGRGKAPTTRKRKTGPQ